MTSDGNVRILFDLESQSSQRGIAETEPDESAQYPDAPEYINRPRARVGAVLFRLHRRPGLPGPARGRTPRAAASRSSEQRRLPSVPRLMPRAASADSCPQRSRLTSKPQGFRPFRSAGPVASPPTGLRTLGSTGASGPVTSAKSQPAPCTVLDVLSRVCGFVRQAPASTAGTSMNRSLCPSPPRSVDGHCHAAASPGPGRPTSPRGTSGSYGAWGPGRRWE